MNLSISIAGDFKGLEINDRIICLLCVLVRKLILISTKSDTLHLLHFLSGWDRTYLDKNKRPMLITLSAIAGFILSHSSLWFNGMPS